MGAIESLRDITERKRAEEENQALLTTVQQEKTKLSALIDSITDEVWFADTQGRITLANPSALREFALTPGEMIEVETLAKSLEVFRPDGSPRPVEESPPLRALAGEVVRNLEEIVRTPASGELRHRQVSSTPVRDATGSIIGAVSVVRDITERKRAEEALRESETQYRKLIETMQDGVYRSSHEGKFLEVNPAMVKILGYDSKEELLAIDIKSQLYFAPQDRESAALDEKLSEMGVFRLKKKDGSEIWVEDHGRHVVDDEGTVLYHEGVLRDITERREVERETILHSHLLDAATDAVLVHDLQGRFLYVNEAACRMHGYTRAELLAIPLAHLVTPESATRIAERIQELEQRKELTFEVEHLTKAGSRIPIEVHASFHQLDGKQYILSVMRDITERKQLEERIRQVRSDLLFAVSHDLKTPLHGPQSIPGDAERAGTGGSPGPFPGVRRDLAAQPAAAGADDQQPGGQSARRGRSLPHPPGPLSTGGDRPAGGGGPDRLRPGPPSTVRPEAGTGTGEHLRRGGHRPGGGEPADQRRQVLAQGGTGSRSAYGWKTRPFSWKWRTMVLGIPANEQEQLFQPFQRSRSAQRKGIPGTGLGLYVCRRIVEAHGGIDLLAQRRKAWAPPSPSHCP